MATKAKEPDTLRIWNALSKTDPRETKQFSRAGGFKGTAVKPMWVIKRLTEQFGPCGTGWGMEEPSFQVVPGHHGEVLVYCTVAGWFIDPGTGTRSTVYGVGGDKIVTHIKANQQYNRPERWENDDEAFKKAFTDAVNNAFKFVGVAADIHMGQFDDSKYVQAVAAEFAANDITTGEEPAKKREKLEGPYTSKTALWKAVKEFDRNIRGCGDLAELIALTETKENEALIEQCKRDAPGLWSDGLPDLPEFVPLAILIAVRKRELEQIDELVTASGIRNVAAG